MTDITTPIVTVSPAKNTTPLYTVYAKYDGDPRHYATGTYDNMADAKAGLQMQIINGGDLSILQFDVTDRTAG